MSDRTRRFEAAMLPHLDAAFNLARWLLRDEHNAQDVVQDAYLRAFRFFDGFRGEQARPWLLGIVRNACFTWMKENRRAGQQVEFDEERDSGVDDQGLRQAADNPETLLMQKLEREQINQAIEALPPLFREVIVLERSCRVCHGPAPCCARHLPKLARRVTQNEPSSGFRIEPTRQGAGNAI